MQALLSGNRDEFARALGYADYEALMLASEVVAVEGDVSWYITRLPDGRWAAWDDAREEALADQCGALCQDPPPVALEAWSIIP